MATQMNTMDEGRPPENINTRIDCGMDNDEINMNKNFLDNKSNSDSCKEKHPKNTPKPKRNSRKLSIVTLSKNHGRSKKYGVFSPHTIPSYHRKENGNTDTANLVGEECTFSDFVEDNSKRFRDANKNTTETTSSQVPLNIKSSIKCEKNCLKSSFVPKLLCLTKNSLEKNNLNLLTQNKNNINTKSASSDSHEKENESKYMNDSLKDEATTDTHCDNSSKPEVVIKNHTAQVNSLVAKDRESSANDEKRAGSTASSSRTSEEGDYTNYGLDKSKFRNSFHQNVEEALNSLLWQPYEYQKSNANRECECDDDDESFYSEGSHTPSWSSCSSDLDDIPSVPTKGTSTKNSIDVVGSTIEQRTSARGTILQAVECTYLRSEDLHSNANSSLLNESPGRDRSRDERFEHSTNAFEPVSSLNLAGETRVAYTAAARSQSSDRVCDVSKSNRSWLSMSHAQNATVNQSSAVTSATNSYRNTNDNGLKSYVDPLLNSANIVGLPSHHTRYASVPSTAFQNGASRSQSTIFPQHVRNTSEPATKYPQNFIPPQSSSTLVPPNAVVPLSNVVPIHRHYPEHSHFRSHSAPKSMPKNEPPTNSCANQQQVGNSRTKPPNMQNNVVPTSRSNQVYIHASDNVQNNAVPASRNGQLICSNTTSQNRYPVVHNSSNQQYQIPNHADGHQQVPNSSAQNTSIFTVNPNANNLTRPLQKPQHSPPNPGSNTPVHPIPNPRVSKIPQQQFTQVNPNQQNVSNVNVNFYRAVPVNVVSSVPTIHCLNTLSNCQGNSVSNVQVLPLGSNFQQLTQATSLTNTVSGTANVTASCTVPNNNIELSQNVSSTQLHSKNVDTATQITLHNTNAIQIAPSNGFHINRNSAFSLPQNHELRNIQVQSKSDSDTMVVPLNEVVVQNVRPTSTTNETIHGGRLITTTAQINSVTTLNSNNTQPQIMTQSTGIPRSRTFTSTEAQTDEILPVLPQQSAAEQTAAQKEQRRKERRERRHHRRAQRQNQTILEDNSTPINQQQHNERLPDILDSHLPPPYSAATSSPVLPPSGRIVPSMVPAAGSRVPAQLVPPPGMVHGAMLSHGPMLQTVVPNAVPTGGFVFPAPHQQMVPGQVPLMQGAQAVPVAVPAPATGFRFPFPANGFRR